MKIKTSLLTALRNYRPRENHDPLENFITEAFAWLLVNYPRFGRFYLNKIGQRLQQPELSSSAEIEWVTQLNLGGVFPDLVGRAGKEVYLFEHKAWSHLHANQLANYRTAASAEYGETSYRLVLIVGGRHLIDQSPDLALCWHEIHAWIGEWRNHTQFEDDPLFADFQRLLEHEGMGPPAPVSYEAALAFRFARSFETTLSELVRRAFHHPWNASLGSLPIKPHLPWHHGLPGGQDPWGRVGINLCGDLSEGAPGLFVGFLIDPADHKVAWADPACPDFGAIFDVNIETFSNYDVTREFILLREALPKHIARDCPDYRVLDHLASSEAPNRWHPLHVRKPMTEFLRGTLTADEQYTRFVSEASRLAKAILDCAEFRGFRDLLLSQRGPVLPSSVHA